MKRCCICGFAIEGMGNNAWPYTNDSNEKCCDECYDKVIQPAVRYANMSWSAVERRMGRGR